jgi:hypothetical protein
LKQNPNIKLVEDAEAEKKRTTYDPRLIEGI